LNPPCRPGYILGAAIYSQRRALQIAQTIDTRNNLQLTEVVLNLPRKGTVVAGLLGFLYAILFNIPGNGLNVLEASPTERAMMLGQTTIWVLPAYLLFVRITTSRAFRRFSDDAPVDIFEPFNLRPFAQLGLIDVLVIDGFLGA